MAIHSRILAWRMLWTEEPGGLQSMRLQRVGRSWAKKKKRKKTKTTTTIILIQVWKGVVLLPGVLVQ